MLKVNLLAINVGNSRAQLGCFVEGALDDLRSLPLDDPGAVVTAAGQMHVAIAGNDDAAVVLCSVNPPVADRLAKQLADRLAVRVYRTGKDLPIPIGRQLDPEAIVGEDRLLNAAAAYDTLKQACVIVDAGSAITVDFVDGAGTFHGGAIGPGARLMMRSLSEHTAQLPEIEFAAPSEVIGHNTAEAMRSAVFHGLRGMVRELVEHYAEAAGAYPMVVATGGDAQVLFKDYELVERIVPELTLMGMAVAARVAMDG